MLKTITDDKYIELAKKKYESEGTLEIDDEAVISRSPEGGGAYVQAWVWVEDGEVKNENRKAQ